MTQAEIEKSLNELNELVLQGKIMEAFEKYYHEDIIMQENSQPATVGKNANREREKDFVKNLGEFRSASVSGLSATDDLSFVIWDFDYTHNEWGERKYSQVSVQRWKDNQIIHEQFYYGN